MSEGAAAPSTVHSGSWEEGGPWPLVPLVSSCACLLWVRSKVRAPRSVAWCPSFLSGAAAPSYWSGFRKGVEWKNGDVKLQLFLILRNNDDSDSPGWCCCSFLGITCAHVWLWVLMWDVNGW